MTDMGDQGPTGGDSEPIGYSLLSVIVPVFNERTTVAEVIRRIRAVTPARGRRGHRGRRRVLRRDRQGAGRHGRLDGAGDQPPVNKGKGAAVRTGLESIRGDLVLIQDADLEYDPADWSKLLDPILRGKSKVVYGSRFTGERKNMMPLHWIGNRFLSLVTNVLYSSTLSDMETCYKLFDRRALEGITIESDKFDFEPEITAKVLRRGTGSTRSRSPTPAGRPTRARRSPGGTDSARCGPWSSTGSPGSTVTDARRRAPRLRRDRGGPGRGCRSPAGRPARHNGGERGRGDRQLRVGPGPGQLCGRASGPKGRPSWWWWTTDPPTARVRRAARSLPRGRGARAGAQPRLRRGRQPRRGHHHRPVGAGVQLRTSRSGPARWPIWPPRWPPTPGCALVGPLIRDQAGERYPSARRFPVPGRRGRACPARDLRPGQPLHPLVPAGGAGRGRPRARSRRLGVRGVLSGQEVGLRAGGWVRRGLLHVPRGRRSVLAPGPGRLAGGLRARRPR